MRLSLGITEEACGRESSAAELRERATSLEAAINRWLWDGESSGRGLKDGTGKAGGDHYVTSVGEDGQVTADFVDYDSNL